MQTKSDSVLQDIQKELTFCKLKNSGFVYFRETPMWKHINPALHSFLGTRARIQGITKRETPHGNKYVIYATMQDLRTSNDPQNKQPHWHNNGHNVTFYIDNLCSDIAWGTDA